METWEGASPLCATGVYMSAADVERVKRERERGWETVPPHSSPQPPPLTSPPSLPLKCSSFSGPFSQGNIHVPWPSEKKELETQKKTLKTLAFICFFS